MILPKNREHRRTVVEAILLVGGLALTTSFFSAGAWSSDIVSAGPIIEIDDLILPAETVPAAPTSTASKVKTLEEVERAHILSMLEKTNWVISGEQGAAVQLGINPNSLRSRIAKLEIKRSTAAQ